jgi:hypothetical protein
LAPMILFALFSSFAAFIAARFPLKAYFHDTTP